MDCGLSCRMVLRTSRQPTGCQVAACMRHEPIHDRNQRRSRTDGQGNEPAHGYCGTLQLSVRGRPRSALGIREQEGMPMKIVERLAVIARCRAQEPAPKGATVLISRTQAVMVPIGELPKIMKGEPGDEFSDLAGHPDQERGEADVLSCRKPRDGQCVPRHFHVADSWNGFTIDIPVAGRFGIRRTSPPRDISELEVSEDQRAQTRSAKRTSVEGRPHALMTARDRGQCLHLSPPGRACQSLQVSIIERLDEFEKRPASPPWRRYLESLFRSIRCCRVFHHRSPSSGAGNLRCVGTAVMLQILRVSTDIRH